MKRSVYLGGWKLVAHHGRTAVTPNENAADTLGVRPLTLEDLAREMVGERRIAHPVVAQRLLGEVVGEVLGGADPEGMARSLLPVVRELFRSSAEIETGPSSPRARRVVEVARAYRRRLRERGFVDPAETLREAVRTSPSRRSVLVWGYPRLGRDELAFLDAVAGDGSALYLPWVEDSLFGENKEAARNLKDRGWSVEEDPMSAVWTAKAPLDAHAYPHVEAEVRGVLAQAKSLLVEGVPPDDIMIVARDDASYGPTVLAVAREYGVPVQLLYRVPVEGTRVGSWLRLLIEVQTDGFPFEETSRLLRHPLGPSLAAKTWSKARGLQPRGAAYWEECGADLSSVDLSRMWPERDTFAGWAGRLRAFLGEHALERKVRRWPREAVALSRLKDSVRWLAGSAAEREERISRDRFLEELAEALAATLTPAHPDGEGVALHTPLSLFGARHRFVFAMGLAEGHFPAPTTDSPMLDFHERKKLREEGVHLELADERARRERLSFWTLLQVPRERLVLSYPKVSGGRSLLPSPYFGLLDAEPAPPEGLPAASPEEARKAFLQRDGPENPVLERAARCWEVEKRREGTEPFDAHDGMVGVPIDREGRRFSASQLGDLARCGFKWWASSVLGLSEPEEGESPALFGSLYHRTLEIAVRRARESSEEKNPRAAALEHLEEAFAEAESERGMHRLRAWEVRRVLHLRLLRGAVEGADFALPEAEVAETECHFTGEWRGYEVAGRLDRVDHTSEGLVLIDYKSGSSVLRPDLQLAIYREAAAPALFPGEEVRDAYYYSLRKGERISAKPPGEEDLSRIAAEILENLEAGRLPPDVLERDPAQQTCEWCGFDLVCRKGPRLARKLGREPERGEEGT